MLRQAVVSGVVLVVLAVVPVSEAGSPPLVAATVPGYHVSVSVPQGWVSVAPPPSFKRLGLVWLRRDPQTILGFHTNLNLVVTPLPRGLTLRQWMFSGASASFVYVGTTTPIKVDGVAGLHYQSTKVQKDGQTPLLTDEYAFVRSGHVYLFTYTALASSSAAELPTFEASARTIRFDVHVA